MSKKVKNTGVVSFVPLTLLITEVGDEEPTKFHITPMTPEEVRALECFLFSGATIIPEIEEVVRPNSNIVSPKSCISFPEFAERYQFDDYLEAMAEDCEPLLREIYQDDFQEIDLAPEEAPASAPEETTDPMDFDIGAGYDNEDPATLVQEVIVADDVPQEAVVEESVEVAEETLEEFQEQLDVELGKGYVSVEEVSITKSAEDQKAQDAVDMRLFDLAEDEFILNETELNQIKSEAIAEAMRKTSFEVQSAAQVRQLDAENTINVRQTTALTSAVDRVSRVGERFVNLKEQELSVKRELYRWGGVIVLAWALAPTVQALLGS